MEEPTTEKLAQALREAGAPQTMIERARKGAYDDYKSESATPIMDLVRDARKHGLMDIAQRAANGEFDAQDWEAEAWANGPDGQATFGEVQEHQKGERIW